MTQLRFSRNVHVCQPPPYHIVSFQSFQRVIDPHTTVSVTKGVGVHPRGGWRSEDGTEVENNRGVAVVADRSTDTGEREADQVKHCFNKPERIFVSVESRL